MDVIARPPHVGDPLRQHLPVQARAAEFRGGSPSRPVSVEDCRIHHCSTGCVARTHSATPGTCLTSATEVGRNSCFSRALVRGSNDSAKAAITACPLQHRARLLADAVAAIATASRRLAFRYRRDRAGYRGQRARRNYNDNRTAAELGAGHDHRRCLQMVGRLCLGRGHARTWVVACGEGHAHQGDCRCAARQRLRVPALASPSRAFAINALTQPAMVR
jgi:hypothetical protein